MIPQPPFTIPSLFHVETILAWYATTLHQGHVAIPSQYFKDGDQITVTAHPDGGLLLFSQSGWQRIADKIKKLPAISEDSTYISEQLLNNVTIKTVQEQRLGIPKSFLEFAVLESEAIWAETDSHVQLWQPARFNEKITDIKQA